MALTEEQRRMRAEAYGASEIATIVRVGPGRLIDLFESKVRPKFDDVDDDPSLPAELGNLLEDPTAQVYARRTATFLHSVRTLRHPTRPLAVATPDRARFTTEDAWARAWERAKQKTVDTSLAMLGLEELDEADRLVEVKTHAAKYRRDYGPAGTGQIPEHEAIQVTWQMGVTGHRIADVAVLFRGDWGVKFEVFTVGFNPDLFEWLYENVERFHTDHVLKQIPPPPDGSDAYDEAMQRLHGVVRKADLPADEIDEDLIMRYAKFAEVERRAGILKKLIGQSLETRIGDAAGIISPVLGRLAWISVRETSTVDWKKAANDALALCGLCLNAFDVTRNGGEHLSDENRATLVDRMKAIVPDAAKPRAGYRYLKLYPKGEAQLELARLQLVLEKLEAGVGK